MGGDWCLARTIESVVEKPPRESFEVAVVQAGLEKRTVVPVGGGRREAALELGDEEAAYHLAKPHAGVSSTVLEKRAPR